MPDRVTLAAIAGAHGVRGEVRLKLFTDAVASLARHKAVFVGGQPMTLERAGGTDKSPTARFAGVASREAAEALRGQLLEVERDSLPPLDEGEYYHADLIGLAAIDQAGGSLGIVVAVENYGAGDLLEVEDAEGKRALVPFRPGIADLAEGKIVIDPEFLA